MMIYPTIGNKKVPRKRINDTPNRQKEKDGRMG